jgi:hypothetical protein
MWKELLQKLRFKSADAVNKVVTSLLLYLGTDNYSATGDHVGESVDYIE